MLNGRLVNLRPMRVSDLTFLTDLANVAGVRHNVVGWNWPIAPDTQGEWLRDASRDPHDHRLTVTDPATDDPVGLTGLWQLDWHNRCALTAVKLMPGATPKGAGSDSIMLVMAWAFHEVGLRRLYSSILDFNAASVGAYVRRCGFRVEGREREAVFRAGRWHDLLRIGILRAEFDALPDADEYVERVCGTLPPAPGRPPVPEAITPARPVRAEPSTPGQAPAAEPSTPGRPSTAAEPITPGRVPVAEPVVPGQPRAAERGAPGAPADGHGGPPVIEPRHSR